ncbi:MAG TPA: YdcF family protein [Alphaproteobacteria bacterium]|nr:YdcF family protein [Alphaproteobacteria bacterium]
MRRKLLTAFGFVFLTAFSLWAAGYIWFACTTAFARPVRLHEKTDAIVVLTGGGGRVLTGLRLFAAAGGGDLFISGVNPSVKAEEIVKMWTGPGALPACCITLGYEAGDTNGNAAETAQWIRAREFRSIRLVTASYHMTRALLLFRRTMPDVDILPFPVRPQGFEAWRGSFWQIVREEYHKTLFTWLRLTLGARAP